MDDDAGQVEPYYCPGCGQRYSDPHGVCTGTAEGQHEPIPVEPAPDDETAAAEAASPPSGDVAETDPRGDVAGPPAAPPPAPPVPPPA